MKIRRGDKVKVMSGKDKGTIGKVLEVNRKNNSVVVEGVNLFKKHQKGEVKGKGEIVMVNKPIDASNVKKYEEDDTKPEAKQVQKADKKTDKKPAEREAESEKKQSTKKASTKKKE